MIKIIAQNSGKAAVFLKSEFDGRLIENDLFVSSSYQRMSAYLKDAVKNAEAVVLTGNASEMKALFAETFDLTMFYDKFAEKNIEKFCELTEQPIPPQYMMDKLCALPETFNNYAVTYGCQSGCNGEYGKCLVFILPDNEKEVSALYETYMEKSLSRLYPLTERRIFKIFALGEKEITEKLNALCNPRFVSHKCETTYLDTKVTLIFRPKCPKQIANDISSEMKRVFGNYLYAEKDVLPEKLAVDILKKLHKTISVAESVTGGMITSKIVDIPGASAVLYEGAVTYSIESKCARLGLNPHFVDEHGVVSSQVAQEMVKGLLKNGSDFAVATTGYAGPETDGGKPAGLCYIGVGSTKGGITVYRNVFGGDRNSVRQQAANSALYLVLKALCL